MAGRKKKPRVVIDGIEYLPSRLLHTSRFSWRIGLKGDALTQISKEGLFPSPAPGLLAGSFYFRPEMARAWWAWLRSGATDAEIERVAQIVRESDPRRVDYRNIRDGADPRSWLLDVLMWATQDKWHRYI